MPLRYFWLGGLALTLWACNSGTPSTTEQTTSTTDSTEVADEEEFKIEKLSTKNAREVLGKFAKKHPETLVLVSTSMGDMKIKLYEDTPLHRANFLQLVKRGYYNFTVFHRVVKGLAIQGGNNDDPMVKKKRKETGSYLVPAEIMFPKYFHKKGALGSPRQEENNPDKLSTPFEFYIVEGTKMSPGQLNMLGIQNQVQFTPEQIQYYSTIGGAPHLDNKYTVFGEVIEGLEVIDKIANVKIDAKDSWPLEDVTITMKVIKK
ncbi:MAG: peptidylprolyl isomerase [Microscillaceae bacterium]|jgi:peptidyl-prolyl cis-trans isomerase B (cyclophilin B)|nr:peptidylprolyl isomerase [Microscillaceae bacterium]